MALSANEKMVQGSIQDLDGRLVITGASTSGVAQPVGGDIAAGVADSGNPVKVGGVYKATPPTLVDGQRGDAQMTNKGALRTSLLGDNNTLVADTSSSVDALTNSNGHLRVLSSIMQYTGGAWDRQRTPNVFKTISATALNTTALWTPAAGKKFRLMAYIIEITSNSSLSAGAIEVVSMLDSAADIAQTHSVFIPTTAVTTGLLDFTTGWINLGNGILSASANNVLNVNLGTALATGAVRITCCGTEE